MALIGKMKISYLVLLCLALAGNTRGGMTTDIRPDRLDRARLEEILKQADRAIVSFYLLPSKVDHSGMSYTVPGTGESIVTDDKEWLAEFSAFLKAIDGKPSMMTPAIEIPFSGVILYHGDKVLFEMYWLGDRAIVMHADGRAFELAVEQDVRVQYEAICGKKKPSEGIQQTTKSPQVKVPLPKIDPKSLEVKLSSEPQKPTQAPSPRG